MIHLILRKVSRLINLRNRFLFCSRFLLFVYQLMFLISKMGLMTFPYLLQSSQDYCFKAQTTLTSQEWNEVWKKILMWMKREQREEERYSLNVQPEIPSRLGQFPPAPSSKRWCRVMVCFSLPPFCSCTFRAYVPIPWQSKYELHNE